jgi:hypothetical protein
MGDNDTAGCAAPLEEPLEFEIARSKTHFFFHS